ncbi:MAG: hypothetical protein ABIP65_02100 [Vicinamibacterales bacterium]
MPKLTIVERPAPMPAVPTDGPGVYVWRDLKGRPCAYGQTVSGRHWMYWPRLATYAFDDAGAEVIAYANDSATPDDIIDTFHRMVLPLALQRRGLEALHASAVTMTGGVVAFCAISGTGKSTLAYAYDHMKGCRQWSDDVLVFDVQASGICAVPLPFDVRLLPEAAAQFVRKRAVNIARPASTPSVERAPLAAVCILARRGLDESAPDVGVRRLSHAEALPAVLAHAHCFNLTDAARKKTMLQHYFDLVEHVPVFEVGFRPGLERLPAVLDGVTTAVSV